MATSSLQRFTRDFSTEFGSAGVRSLMLGNVDLCQAACDFWWTDAFGSKGCASSGFPAAGHSSGAAARGMSRSACGGLFSCRDSRRVRKRLTHAAACCHCIGNSACSTKRKRSEIIVDHISNTSHSTARETLPIPCHGLLLTTRSQCLLSQCPVCSDIWRCPSMARLESSQVALPALRSSAKLDRQPRDFFFHRAQSVSKSWLQIAMPPVCGHSPESKHWCTTVPLP